MTTQMRDGSEVTDPRLGRLRQFDERSRGFRYGTIYDERPIITKGWSVAHWFDQGWTSECVGHAWTHEAAARPERTLFDDDYAGHEYAGTVYEAAKLLDEWEGEDYEGTSVLAGAKVMRERGFITGYRWGFNLREILHALSYEGPVVMGTDWYSGMYETDDNGFIHREGDNEGGHAYLLSSVWPGKKAVRVWNSWGEEWGDNGRAFLSFDDLEDLLHNYGEACIPFGRQPLDFRSLT